MINVSEMARRLSTAVGRLSHDGRRAAVTPDLVLALLQPADAAERAVLELEHDPRLLREVEASLATLPRVLVEERLQSRHPGFARYFDCLPRLVSLRMRGYSSDEIAEQIHFMATGYGVDTVFRLVAETIARRFNRR